MSSGLPESFIEKFENMIAEAMTGMHIPGLSVAMVKDGRVVYRRGFGARRLKDNLSATPDTIYGIGSCTKSFTALAVMQLAEQGKLDVQDPVDKHIPFKLGRDENPIRIHHLLSMSSGIPNLGVAELLISKFTGEEEMWVPMSSVEDLFLHVNGAGDEIAAPGERMFYFNTGYTLLGEIVERVSGRPYEKYVKEKILEPLKMSRSTFLEEDCERDPDVMTAYRTERREGKVRVTPSKHPFHKFVYAPGGLLSSVDELTHYLLANMNGGAFEDARVLDASLMDELQKVQFDTDYFRFYMGDYGRMGYGYGWIVAEDFLGHKLVTHGGSTGVSSASLMFVPDIKVGVAAACNVGSGPTPIYLGALAYLMGKDPEKEIPDFEIDKKLGMLAGKYTIYKGIHEASVVKKGAMLYVEIKYGGDEISYPLIPETDNIDDFRFYAIVGPGKKQPVEFVVESQDRIDMYIERNRFHKITGRAPTSL
ncbi:MAG: serine hydrolase [Candidatus Bathyarchaeia archaeon]